MNKNMAKNCIFMLVWKRVLWLELQLIQ